MTVFAERYMDEEMSALSLAEMRSRLRTTLEISGAEPFWEERLFSTAGNLVPFQVGVVHFLGANPCQRCIVPTRDHHRATPGFIQSQGRKFESPITPFTM